VARRLYLMSAAYGAVLATALAVHGPHPLKWIGQFAWGNHDPVLSYGRVLTTPVIGNHHFGDWQVYLMWAKDPNPYLLHDGGLPSLPPVLFALRAVDGLPVLVSWLLLTIASAVTIQLAVHLLLPQLRWYLRLAIGTGCMLLSAGMISSIDRGSVTALAAGFVGLWLWAADKHRPWLAGAFLAVAIVLKPYLALLLLWPLIRRRQAEVIATTLFVGVPSIVGFAVLPGSIMRTATGFMRVSGQYAGSWADEIYISTHSMASLIIDPVLLLSGNAGLTESWITALPSSALLAPGLLWLGVVTYVTARRTVSEPLVVCLTLSLAGLVLPSSLSYTTVFAGFGAVVLFSNPTGPTREKFARRAVQSALWLTILPIPLSFGGSEVPSPVGISAFLSPTAWLVAGLACALAPRLATAAHELPELPSLGVVPCTSACRPAPLKSRQLCDSAQRVDPQDHPFVPL
jgi:hypothetical protein